VSRSVERACGRNAVPAGSGIKWRIEPPSLKSAPNEVVQGNVERPGLPSIFAARPVAALSNHDSGASAVGRSRLPCAALRGSAGASTFNEPEQEQADVRRRCRPPTAVAKGRRLVRRVLFLAGLGVSGADSGLGPRDRGAAAGSALVSGHVAPVVYSCESRS
jgi:hypothetical protein